MIKKKNKTFNHTTKWFSANFGFCNVVEIRGSKILPKIKWFSPCLRKSSLIFFFLFSCKSFLSNQGEVVQKIGGIDLLPWNPQRWINVLVATYMQAWTVEHGCFSNYSCIANLHGENLGLIKNFLANLHVSRVDHQAIMHHDIVSLVSPFPAPIGRATGGAAQEARGHMHHPMEDGK